MSKEVVSAIKAICEEKHISVESVLATIEQALAAAYRKDFGNRMQNLKVEFNPETMAILVFDVKEVVEDQDIELDEEGRPVFPPHEFGQEEGKRIQRKTDEGKPSEGAKDAEGTLEEEDERFNPKTQIMLTQAKEIKKDAQIGEELVQELQVPGEFGRMAAQTAKQVIIQRLREAEREVVYNEYKDKEGQLVNGSVQRVENGVVLIDIGQATAIMPPSEQVRGEHYSPGAQLRLYIKSVSTSNKGPEVIVSRSDKELVRQLFDMEVPEIAEGAVIIKAIAREPGSRTKIAVHTDEENVDPVGSCVGQRGTRVQFIINEMGGEKIDIIEWDEDEVKFIKNSLSPAKVVDIKLNPEQPEATAFVAEDQFSLAIGKQGQNVRLASALTGRRIDIKQAGEVESADDGDGGEKSLDDQAEEGDDKEKVISDKKEADENNGGDPADEKDADKEPKTEGGEDASSGAEDKNNEPQAEVPEEKKNAEENDKKEDK